MARWPGRGIRLLIAIAALCAALTPASAQAVPASTPDQAAVTNGTVSAIARGGGLTYIGGSFTELSIPQPGFGQVNAVTGRYSGMPSVAGGTASLGDVVADGAGGYYIGGSFTSVGGVARTNLAHVLADGSVDLAFNAGSINGFVTTLELSGGELYAGGIGISTIGGQTRTGLAKLSATSGNAFTGFNANLNIASVNAIEVSGTAVFIGGGFTEAGGEPREFIAKLSTATGNAFTGWDAGNVQNTPEAIQVDGSDVYVGGRFTGDDSIGGLHRDFIAKLSATSGNAFSGWDPDANGIVFALAVSGTDVFAGGQFSQINGQARDAVAKLSATSGNAFSGFNPEVGAQPSSVVQIFALAVSGSSLFMGGNFASVNGATRNHVAKLSTSSGSTFTSFNPNAEGTTVTKSVFGLAVSGSDVALAGEFTTLNRVTRNGVAALDTNGAPTDFNPNANSDVQALAVDGSGNVYAGGFFSNIGGENRNRIAKLSAASGNAFSTWNPNASDDVLALAVSGSELYVGGRFDDGGVGAISIGGQSRNRIAKLSTSSGNAFSTWDPDAENTVRTIVPSGSEVFVGGDFDTIGGLARPFVAKLSAASGNAFSGFNANSDSSLDTLALSGSELYAGGTFTDIGGEARNKVAKLSATTGNAFSLWNPNATGGAIPQVTTIDVAGSEVYVGGSFTNIGGSARNNLAALSATSGNAFSGFNPNPNDIILALDAPAAGEVHTGGSFTQVGGIARRGYAHFTAP